MNYPIDFLAHFGLVKSISVNFYDMCYIIVNYIITLVRFFLSTINTFFFKHQLKGIWKYESMMRLTRESTLGFLIPILTSLLQEFVSKAALSTISTFYRYLNSTVFSIKVLKYWKSGFNDWLIVCCFSSHSRIFHLYRGSPFSLKGCKN